MEGRPWQGSEQADGYVLRFAGRCPAANPATGSVVLPRRVSGVRDLYPVSAAGAQRRSAAGQVDGLSSRIGRILEGEKLIYAILTAETLPEPATPQTPTTHDISFRDVDFSYGKTEILHGVGFTAPEGTVTALVGPSGAGKTTVGRLIPRFWDVTGGEIQIGGADHSNIAKETP